MKKNKLVICILSLVIILSLVAISEAESAYGPPIEKNNYEISRSKVDRTLPKGDIFTDSIRITNKGGSEIQVSAVSSEDLSSIIEFESSGAIITPQNYTDIFFKITARQLGEYNGEITLSGGLEERIPTNITIVNKSANPQFFVDIELFSKKFTFNNRLDFKVDVNKITTEQIRNVTFVYKIMGRGDNSSFNLGSETKDILGSLQIRKQFEFPKEAQKGFYILDVLTDYKNKTYVTSAEFELRIPFWEIKLLGFLPIWLFALLLGIGTVGIGGFVFIRRMIEKNKKYKMQVDTKTLPKKGERTLWLGKIAETNLTSYYEMDNLTTHAVVAGATGGGKSITAQVLIEEALIKNTAVIIFDPTAQWSGMLRKNEDKKMLSFYQKFGMKSKDARAFPGNVRQIMNERQKIDVEKYMNPGQIQIFTMNKLTPPQIDTFVASVIANIFRSDPKEFPQLRLLIVFDEVHRLLPKFGGSGKGFLQIERACREFRKWGYGVMLVSQVLSDFVGEIKANINTEIQMRTRDEADLNRLKTKYGEEFLQSLIKASVGVGMFINPKYNRGKPYFVQFRPILHSTRRLSDEVLEQYNKYGEIIDDIQFQIEQLEKEKIDTFDLKMELKLVKDKLMTGNFTVVNIYLESLQPRVEKEWAKLGKKAPKREIELVDAKEIEASLKQAEVGRKDFEEEKEEEKEAPAEKKEEEKPKPKEESKPAPKVEEKKPETTPPATKTLPTKTPEKKEPPKTETKAPSTKPTVEAKPVPKEESKPIQEAPKETPKKEEVK
ncbi:MAG: DUF87 domain-containing protein [archaeon]